MSHNKQDDILGHGILSLIVLSGIAFSGISFLVLDDGFQDIFSSNDEKSISSNICENGLCYTENSNAELNKILVQLEADASNTNQVSQNEDFSNLKFAKNHPVKELVKSGNKLTIFAEKDSFIREGVKNANEGSSEFLRVLGAGPTNNRALISFNLDDIEELSSGKTLQSATIKLHVEKNNRHWGDGQYVSIHSLKTSWDEGNGINAPVSNLIKSDGVTWNCPVNSKSCNKEWNGGLYNQIPTDSIWISNQVDDYWIKFDVTLDILNYQESKQNFGWIILKNDESSEGQINIASREALSNNPELVLVFLDE